MELIRAAQFVATMAHKGQVRKYDGLPYIQHPARVATMVGLLPTSTPEMVAAAWLHDTLEDTDVTFENLRDTFGWPVAKLVQALTNEFTKEKYPTKNRKWRKTQEALRTGSFGWRVQNIKLADVIDNTRDIVANDPEFAVTYLEEKRFLLSEMSFEVHPFLFKLANHNVGA